MSDDDKQRVKLAESIIDAGCYKVFWDKPKSEWPVTFQGDIRPAFCNLRSIIGNVELRDRIVKALVKDLKKPDNTDSFPEIICGVVSSGVPWASLLSDKLKLPMCYTRPSLKKHDNRSSLEGSVTRGSKLLLLDDVFATGITYKKTAFQLLSTGAQITRAMVILRLGNKAVRLHSPDGEVKTLAVDSLIDYDDLLKASVEKRLMNQDQADRLAFYYQNPDSQPWD